MSYQKKEFSNLGELKILSEQNVKNHEGLYEGYIKNINKLNDALIQIEKDGNFDKPEYAELNRRFGWEWNGMRLHELYFENIIEGGKFIGETSKLYRKIVEEYGSYDEFIQVFKSLSSIRGIGWVVLCYDRSSDHLCDIWINEHDTGYLAGTEPLLVMDLFEHAYMLDFGTKKADYIDIFDKLINWEVAEKRYNN